MKEKRSLRVMIDGKCCILSLVLQLWSWCRCGWIIFSSRNHSEWRLPIYLFIIKQSYCYTDNSASQSVRQKDGENSTQVATCCTLSGVEKKARHLSLQRLSFTLMVLVDEAFYAMRFVFTFFAFKFPLYGSWCHKVNVLKTIAVLNIIPVLSTINVLHITHLKIAFVRFGITWDFFF